MRSVGLKTLRNKLSEYARLLLSEATPADAVRRGLITPAALPPGPPPASAPVATLPEVLAELAADRDGR